jgi:hypothetical protein
VIPLNVGRLVQLVACSGSKTGRDLLLKQLLMMMLLDVMPDEIRRLRSKRRRLKAVVHGTAAVGAL